MMTGETITKLALEAGFAEAGFARSKALDEDIAYLKRWLEEGRHADMTWLERHPERRGTPQPWVKTVIVCVKKYECARRRQGEERRAAYSLGEDYHVSILRMLRHIGDAIRAAGGRAKESVDTGAIFEKAWAREAGLGFVGRNQLFISNRFGPFVLLGVIQTDLEVAFDPPRVKAYAEECGSCRACIRACPTGALDGERIDCRECIAWLTVEKRGGMTDAERERALPWVYGCDDCLDACPLNARGQTGSES